MGRAGFGLGRRARAVRGGIASWINKLLTGTFFSKPAPAWTTNPSILRYMPYVLENPIRPGETLDFQGNLILPAIADSPSTARLWNGANSLDPELHYLIDRDSYAVKGVPLVNSIQISGPGSLRIMGIDLGAYKLTITQPLKLYLEGCRADMASSPIEDDALNIGGNGTDYITATSEWTIQNWAPRNLKGTNRAHALFNTLLAPITTDAAKVARIQLAQAPTTPVVVGNDVIITGTVFGGVSRNLNDFNKTWTVKTITSQTDFTVEIAATSASFYKTSTPASAATDNTTGRVWVMASGNGNHADGLQHVNTAGRYSKSVRVHNMSVYANYVGMILQNVKNRIISNFNYIFTHADPLLWPTDDGSEVIRNGNQAKVDGVGYAEEFQVFGVVRPAWTISQQVSPSTLGSEGGVAITTTQFGASRNAITYNRPEFRGGVIEGPVPSQFWRTNLCAQSQNPADVQWTVAAAAKTSTNNADPFGTSTALLVTADGTSAAHYGLAGSAMFGYTTGLAYTVSCFVKAGTQSIVQLTLPSAVFGALARANFDLATGVVGSVTGGTATISPVGNGWYRISLTATSTITAAANGGAFVFVTATNATRLEVNTLATNFYAIGWQVERSAKATDYIPTTAAARTVTDFVDYDAMGFVYVVDNSRYYGYVAPLASHITDIVFEGGTSNIPESIVGGATIGTFRAVHTLGDHPGIIDFTIVSTNVLANQLFWHGRRMVRGKTAISYTSTPGNAISITVRAQWRGTNQYRDKAFVFPVLDDVAASGLTLGTPALGTASFNAAPVSPQAYTALGTGATPGANRYVLAFAANWFSVDNRTLGATASIANATDGTLSAAKVAGKRCLVTNSNWCEAAIYVANVPSLTAADVTITTSGAATAGAVATVVLKDLDTGAPFSTSAVNTDAVGGTVQFTIDIPANGAAVLGCAYATPTGNNKRFSNAVISSGTLATVYARCTTSGGTAVWERSADGVTWTGVGITSLHDTAVEASGGAGTVMVGASFAPR